MARENTPMVRVMEKTREIIAECLKCGYVVYEDEQAEAATPFCPRCGRPDLIPVQQLPLEGITE